MQAIEETSHLSQLDYEKALLEESTFSTPGDKNEFF